MKKTAFERIRETGVVSALRGVEQEHLKETLDAFYEGGVRSVEITMNTAGALRLLETAKALYGDRMAIGAGTVLEEVSARSAILAGADFVLAPTLSRRMIELCLSYGTLVVPGAFSPTEVLDAWQAGAQIVKVFPCGSVGPAYIKDLKGPLPQIRMMPMGGVTTATADAFFNAGSFAVGVGSCLFDPALARAGRFDELRNRAAEFIRLAAENPTRAAAQ